MTTDPSGLSIHFPLLPSTIVARVSGKINLKTRRVPTAGEGITPAGRTDVKSAVSSPRVQFGQV